MSEESWSAIADRCAVEIELAVHEIERELRRHLDPVERVAIAFALERFAERWPHQKEFRPW